MSFDEVAKNPIVSGGRFLFRDSLVLNMWLRIPITVDELRVIHREIVNAQDALQTIWSEHERRRLGKKKNN